VKALWYGYVTGPVIGVLWAFVAATALAVVLSFSTGDAFRPGLWGSVVMGALVGLAAPDNRASWLLAAGAAVIGFALSYTGFSPIHVAGTVGVGGHLAAGAGFGLALAWPVSVMMADAPRGALDRHEWEEAVIRFLTGFGYVFFTAAVAIPFYVMVMTSLKTQGELIANPLDFSIDLSQGWALFRSYEELFRDFNFGQYMWTSFYVSVLTVLITLLFSIPGAYAVARLRFRGQKALSRSILLIYMVPMIVLALPIYIAFSVTGLQELDPGHRDDLPGHDHSGRALHAAGLFPRASGGDRGGGADGRAQPVAGDLEDHAAALAARAGLRLSLRFHDRVERVPAGLHAAGRSVQVHADAGDRLAQLLGDPAPAPDGGGRDRDGAGDGAVSGSGEVHDPGADGGVGQGMSDMFDTIDAAPLDREAERILRLNDRGGYTVPTAGTLSLPVELGFQRLRRPGASRPSIMDRAWAEMETALLRPVGKRHGAAYPVPPAPIRAISPAPRSGARRRRWVGARASFHRRASPSRRWWPRVSHARGV
jgi:hypothetical protein